MFHGTAPILPTWNGLRGIFGTRFLPARTTGAGAAAALPRPLQYKKSPSSTWIVKPTARSQGKGIFLVNRLAQVKQWAGAQFGGGFSSGGPRATLPGSEAFVVSRYLSDPLLVGGRKFDLRIYVLVTSYRPLRALRSRLGFARFCSVKYTAEQAELDNQARRGLLRPSSPVPSNH